MRWQSISIRTRRNCARSYSNCSRSARRLSRHRPGKLRGAWPFPVGPMIAACVFGAVFGAIRPYSSSAAHDLCGSCLVLAVSQSEDAFWHGLSRPAAVIDARRQLAGEGLCTGGVHARGQGPLPGHPALRRVNPLPAGARSGGWGRWRQQPGGLGHPYAVADVFLAKIADGCIAYSG